MALTATVPNAQYSFISPRRQLFSFPPDVISSMLENPSSHIGLIKLYQTCKYFYAKRPILITDYVAAYMEEINDYLFPDGKLVIQIHDQKSGNIIDVSNLQIPIWPTYKIYFNNKFWPIPKFFRYSSIEELSISDAEVPYNDFLLLTSGKKISHFGTRCSKIRIVHSDGSNATLEEVLQQLPNVKYFTYFIDGSCTGEMIARFNAMKFTHKFEYIYLDCEGIHPTFDMNEFCEFIKKNTTVATKMRIGSERSENLKRAIHKLHPKWRKEAHRELKKWFFFLDPNWDQEICLVCNPALSKIPVDEILRQRPNIQYFQYNIDANCTAKTLQKLIQIKCNRKFEYFFAIFYNISPSFDMNLFCEFVTKNSNASTDIYIFPRGATKAKLKKALQKLDSKWKKEANDGLKQMFRDINPHWQM